MPIVLLETFLLRSDPPILEFEKLPNTSIESDRGFLKTAFDNDRTLEQIEFSPWSVRFVLDHEKLVQHQYTTTFIAASLRKYVQDWASVFNSDDNDCDITKNIGGIIRICLHAAPLEKELDWQKPNSDMLLDATALENVTEEQWKFSCCEQYAQQALMHCLTVKVGGISGVLGSVPRRIPTVKFCPETGKQLKDQHEWVINTQGTNLKEVLTLEGVDWTRTCCNHAIEVQKVLGIEAARAVLLEELRKVFLHCGSYVDYRFMALLVDKMTADGQVTPVSRHAFRKMLTGPYTRAAFEQQTDVLCDAGIFSEFEDGNDMRAAIMMGKHIPQGTGTMFDTLCSLDALTSQSSKTMQKIHEERNVVNVPRNPFGFTGVRAEETKKCEIKPASFAVPSNPFFNRPLLSSTVLEKKNPTFIQRTIGKRFRTTSPSMFLQ